MDGFLGNINFKRAFCIHLFDMTFSTFSIESPQYFSFSDVNPGLQIPMKIRESFDHRTGTFSCKGAGFGRVEPLGAAPLLSRMRRYTNAAFLVKTAFKVI